MREGGKCHDAKQKAENRRDKQESLELGCELIHGDGQWSLNGETENCGRIVRNVQIRIIWSKRTSVPDILRLEAHLSRSGHNERNEVALKTSSQHQASTHRVDVGSGVLDLGSLLLEGVGNNGGGLNNHTQQSTHLRLGVSEVGVSVDEAEDGVETGVTATEDGMSVSGNNVALLESTDDVVGDGLC